MHTLARINRNRILAWGALRITNPWWVGRRRLYFFSGVFRLASTSFFQSNHTGMAVANTSNWFEANLQMHGEQQFCGYRTPTGERRSDSIGCSGRRNSLANPDFIMSKSWAIMTLTSV